MFCYSICVLESFLLRGPVHAGRRGGGRLRHERLLVDAAEPEKFSLVVQNLFWFL